MVDCAKIQHTASKQNTIKSFYLNHQNNKAEKDIKQNILTVRL